VWKGERNISTGRDIEMKKIAESFVVLSVDVNLQ